MSLICPMCGGKGKTSPPDSKCKVVFESSPQDVSTQQMAFIMAQVGPMWELQGKLGLDPHGSSMTVSFPDGKKFTFKVEREG